MTQIFAHDRTPVSQNGLLGNSYEELGWMLKRGFGLSMRLRATADHEWVVSTETDLGAIQGSPLTGRIVDTPSADLRVAEFNGGDHLPVFNEILSVARGFIKAKQSPHLGMALHLDDDITPEALEAFAIKMSWMYPQHMLVSAPEDAVRSLSAKGSKVPFAFRAARLSDQSDADFVEKRSLYAWIWLEGEGTDLGVSFEADVARARKIGFKIAISGNASSAFLKRALAIHPDIVCTDDPQAAKEELLATSVTFKDRTVSALKRMASAFSVFRLRHRLSRMRHDVLLRVLEYVEVRSGFLITFHRRPFFSSGVTDACDPLVRMPNAAIVLQGALLKTHDFTLETIRIYKKFYPGIRLIVSTWEGEDAAYVERIRGEGATVLLNQKPSYNGPFNINFQIISAFRGIEEAKRQGAAQVLKTRTDQRMYNKNNFETMENLLAYFPPSERSHQKQRLLFVHGGNKYQPFHLPDVFVFGAIEDMLEYWEPTLVDQKTDYANFLPEIHLASRFLKKKGWTLDWTTQAMWQTHRECFIALDWSDVELYWYKYDRYHEHMDRKSYLERVPVYDHLSFFEWFNIFAAQENKKLLPVHGLFMREFPPRTKD